MTFDAAATERKAAEMRSDILKMITLAGSGHPGGSLSATDIVATLFFGDVLRYRPEEPGWPSRDRFILSKGHAAPVLYAALARAGYFELSELATLRKFGSRLQGHPDSRKLPGVEVATGSLGQGLSIGVGMAYGLSVGTRDAQGVAVAQDASEHLPRQVYVLLGDGELQEGQVWEAALFAAHKATGNLIAIVDNNGFQIDGSLDEVVGLGDIVAKFSAFGWMTFEVDGHDIVALKQAFDTAVAYQDGPAVIVAHTVKGKGVSFMEGQCAWHGKAPSDEQCDNALAELALSPTARTEVC
ncbi:MAG: transketolase [Coriobacteriales bacterium]|jgi:transketolase|nr:transketolase [Coriobacteriales bacterium]